MKPPPITLPPIDKPRHEQGDTPCSQCCHSLRDSRGHWRCEMFAGHLCVFVRDDIGDCGPDALHWRRK